MNNNITYLEFKEFCKDVEKLTPEQFAEVIARIRSKLILQCDESNETYCHRD